MAKNEGKKFEEDFQNSIPEDVWFKRLNDNASSFAGGSGTRFTSTNECDYLMMDDKTRLLMAIELKSTISSLTYWHEKFEVDGQKYNAQIKKNQILGLLKWSKHNMKCGIVMNFRNHDNRTFFIEINDFVHYTDKLLKKSIGFEDVMKMNPVEIFGEKKRTRWRYNKERFIEEVNKEK